MLYQGDRNESRLSCSDGVNIGDEDTGPLCNTTALITVARYFLNAGR
jgi:hypothetical protein